MDNNKNSNYCCKCYFTDELILCEECSKWVYDVETTIEKHSNEFKPVLNAKIWKNNKKNKSQKNNYVYISFHYIMNGVFQLNQYLNNVLFCVYVFNVIL